MYILTTQLQLPLAQIMKQIGSIEKKIENLIRNLTILLSDKLQIGWICRHTFMANSSLVAIGDRVANRGHKPSTVCVKILSYSMLNEMVHIVSSTI
jgi:hypothetical protein